MRKDTFAQADLYGGSDTEQVILGERPEGETDGRGMRREPPSTDRLSQRELLELKRAQAGNYRYDDYREKVEHILAGMNPQSLSEDPSILARHVLDLGISNERKRNYTRAQLAEIQDRIRFTLVQMEKERKPRLYSVIDSDGTPVISPDGTLEEYDHLAYALESQGKTIKRIHVSSMAVAKELVDIVKTRPSLLKGITFRAEDRRIRAFLEMEIAYYYEKGVQRVPRTTQKKEDIPAETNNDDVEDIEVHLKRMEKLRRSGKNDSEKNGHGSDEPRLSDASTGDVGNTFMGEKGAPPSAPKKKTGWRAMLGNAASMLAAFVK